VTDKGDELYFQTSGPGQEGGGLHLRIKVETSSRELYWLNEIVGESSFPTLYLLRQMGGELMSVIEREQRSEN